MYGIFAIMLYKKTILQQPRKIISMMMKFTYYEKIFYHYYPTRNMGRTFLYEI